MPTFYEGEPIAKLSFVLSKEDYQKAYYLKQNYEAAISGRIFRSGLCLLGAAICAALIPTYIGKYASCWIPAVCAGVFLLGFLYYLLFVPKLQEETGEEIFRSNALLKNENQVEIYRDSIIYRNQDEVYRQYWTDFSKCIESKEQILLIGGVRNLLILKKAGLSEKEAERLSEHFSAAFAAKYKRVRR